MKEELEKHLYRLRRGLFLEVRKLDTAAEEDCFPRSVEPIIWSVSGSVMWATRFHRMVMEQMKP